MMFPIMVSNGIGSKKRNPKVWIHPSRSGIRIREILNQLTARSKGLYACEAHSLRPPARS